MFESILMQNNGPTKLVIRWIINSLVFNTYTAKYLPNAQVTYVKLA